MKIVLACSRLFSYLERTRRNVQATDSTVILNIGQLDGGTHRTVSMCEQYGKPRRVVQLDNDAHFADIAAVREWLKANRVAVLNIAGPRESKRPGIYARALTFLDALAGG